VVRNRGQWNLLILLGVLGAKKVENHCSKWFQNLIKNRLFCESVFPFSEAEPIYIHFLMYCKTFKFFDAVLLMNFQANATADIKKRIISKTFLRKRYDASVK
jgi:hypothetical protein